MTITRLDRRSDDGAATAELLVFVTVLVLLGLFIVYVGRLTTTRAEVNAAAHAAARAASLARSTAAAIQDARDAAIGQLGDRDITCAGLRTTVDTDRFRPGGSVTVTVTCTADNTDLTGFGLPGHTTISGSSTSPVDQYRGTR